MKELFQQLGAIVDPHAVVQGDPKITSIGRLRIIHSELEAEGSATLHLGNKSRATLRSVLGVILEELAKREAPKGGSEVGGGAGRDVVVCEDGRHRYGPHAIVQFEGFSATISWPAFEYSIGSLPTYETRRKEALALANIIASMHPEQLLDFAQKVARTVLPTDESDPERAEKIMDEFDAVEAVSGFVKEARKLTGVEPTPEMIAADAAEEEDYDPANPPCTNPGGHEWPRDIEETDRCLCIHCGADGDA